MLNRILKKVDDLQASRSSPLWNAEAHRVIGQRNSAIRHAQQARGLLSSIPFQRHCLRNADGIVCNTDCYPSTTSMGEAVGKSRRCRHQAISRRLQRPQEGVGRLVHRHRARNCARNAEICIVKKQ
jgi:hypothetical protein